ncbi:hypothetical protein LTS18_010839, partial [Coniosporium uncinatum]
ILREGFDVEGVSRAWSEEIQGLEREKEASGESAEGDEGTTEDEEDNSTAVSMYEYTIRDPSAALQLPGTSTGNGIEVECEDQQAFLDKQQSILEQLRLEDEREKDRKAKEEAANGGSTRKAPGFNFPGLRETDGKAAEDVVGPVQFNVGGIHMDADDVVKRIKDREANRSDREESPEVDTPTREVDNETLKNFFAGLAKRGGAGSASNSPRTK